jgi:hypothetical protein
MNIREISKPLTAKALNESLAKRFGKRIALEDFTLEQLQNARNKLRTTLSQVETNESFNTVQSETYQKNKLFLDVLNAEISEREDIDETKQASCPCNESGTKCTCPKSCSDCNCNESKKDVDEASKAKPDYIDIDGDGDKKEPMKKAVKDKKKTDEAKKAGAPAGKPYKLGADKGCKPGFVLDSKTGMCMPKAPKGMSQAQSNNESIVREGAEDQAELVMAAKDMVDRLTGWMEDTAEMQTESMLELADAIRDEMGQEASDSFTNAVKPALEQLYAAMETTRQALTGGVGQLTGEAQPAPDMGAEPETDMDMEPTVDGEADLDAELSTDAAAPAAGGEEEAGREKRESRDYRDIAKAVMERTRKKSVSESSQRLASILSKKKD